MRDVKIYIASLVTFAPSPSIPDIPLSWFARFARRRIREVRREMEWKERERKDREQEIREEEDRKRKERIKRNRREREKREVEERERWERNERREEIRSSKEWKRGEFGGGRRTELEGLNAAMGERLREHFRENARDRREQGDWYVQYVEMEEKEDKILPTKEVVWDIIPEGIKKEDLGDGRGMYGNYVGREEENVEGTARTGLDGISAVTESQQELLPDPSMQFVKIQLDRWGDKQREVKEVMARVGKMQEEMKDGSRQKVSRPALELAPDLDPISARDDPLSDEGVLSPTLKLTVLKANGLPTLLGETKAYCTAKYKGMEKRTQVKRGTDVMWNDTLVFKGNVDEDVDVEFSLWSKNVFVSDDYIGSFEVFPRDIKGGRTVVKEIKGKEGATQGLVTIVGGGVLDDLL